MKKFVSILIACIICITSLVGCSNNSSQPTVSPSNAPNSASSAATASSDNNTVPQKNSFSMYSCYVEAEVAALVDAFTKETGIKVNYVRLSAGEMQARVEAEKENPKVAMIFGHGVDLALAMNDEGLLDTYVPSNIDQIYPE